MEWALIIIVVAVLGALLFAALAKPEWARRMGLLLRIALFLAAVLVMFWLLSRGVAGA